MEDKKKHAQSSEEVTTTPKEMKLLAAPKQKTPPPKKSSRINQPLQTKHFVLSQLTILIISLLFLGGMYWILNNDNFQNTLSNTYSVVTAKKASFGLEIKSPDNELLTFSKELEISGKTAPKASLIFVVTGTSTQFEAVDANSNGEFTTKVSLQPGLNTIEISAFENGNRKTETRTVYYSEEVLQ